MLKLAETPGRESLEEMAILALEFGRLLMEAGAGARSVEEITRQVSAGLGAERTDLRVGYASLAITIGIGPDGITRMRKVGPLGVNQSLDHALRTAAARIERGGFTVAEARAELDRLVSSCPRYPDWGLPWRWTWRAPLSVGCWVWTGRVWARSLRQRRSARWFGASLRCATSTFSSAPRW